MVLTSPLAARSFARTDGTLHGSAELEDYLALGFHAAPDVRYKLQHTLAGVDGVTVVYAREDGALVAEVMILDAAGRVCRAWTFYHGLEFPEWPAD